MKHRRRYIGQEYDEPYLVSAVPEEVIRSLPPADVVEVRHGRWQFEIDENMSWCTKAICTSCKQVVADNADLIQTWGKGLFLHDNLYCRNCGAKMDGE
ncbi:MAG: hypothetical protein J6T10_32125 [Methanobrevibacter sp.]|nr:hypothetical protein [Methanobrevibacter sp.]